MMNLVKVLLGILRIVPYLYMRGFQTVFLYIHPDAAVDSDWSALLFGTTTPADEAPAPATAIIQNDDDKTTIYLASPTPGTNAASSWDDFYLDTTATTDVATAAVMMEDDDDDDKTNTRSIPSPTLSDKKKALVATVPSYMASDNLLVNDKVMLSRDFALPFASSKALWREQRQQKQCPPRPTRQPTLAPRRRRNHQKQTSHELTSELLALLPQLASAVQHDYDLAFSDDETTLLPDNETISMDDQETDYVESPTLMVAAFDDDQADKSRSTFWERLFLRRRKQQPAGEFVEDTSIIQDATPLEKTCQSFAELLDNVLIHRECGECGDETDENVYAMSSTEVLHGIASDMRSNVCFQDPAHCHVELRFGCYTREILTSQAVVGDMKYTCLNLEAIRKLDKDAAAKKASSIVLIKILMEHLQPISASILAFVGLAVYMFLHCVSSAVTGSFHNMVPQQQSAPSHVDDCRNLYSTWRTKREYPTVRRAVAECARVPDHQAHVSQTFEHAKWRFWHTLCAARTLRQHELDDLFCDWLLQPTIRLGVPKTIAGDAHKHDVYMISLITHINCLAKEPANSIIEEPQLSLYKKHFYISYFEHVGRYCYPIVVRAE